MKKNVKRTETIITIFGKFWLFHRKIRPERALEMGILKDLIGKCTFATLAFILAL
jgi:hypothetical protein